MLHAAARVILLVVAAVQASSQLLHRLQLAIALNHVASKPTVDRDQLCDLKT